MHLEIVDPTLVKQIKWNGNPEDYDSALFDLCEHPNSLIVNPWVNDPVVDQYIETITNIPEIKQCIVWKYKGAWVAKYFSKYWTPRKGYFEIDFDPDIDWERNPDIDPEFVFDNDPATNFIPSMWEYQYQFVWYLDPKFNSTDDKVWAVRCNPKGQLIFGVKEMGYVTPKLQELSWKINPDLEPSLTFLSDPRTTFVPSVWDKDTELVWYVDPKFNTSMDRVWALSCKPYNKQTTHFKDMGYVFPELKIEYNTALPEIELDIDTLYPAYFDLNKECSYELDDRRKKHVWVVKISPPHIVPEHTKVLGKIKLLLSKKLDVIFISYNEPNAEDNWQRVLKIAPWAKRVSGVTGIFEAHKAAAKLSSTDMFFVVDGDAQLVDDWNFNFQPGVFDRDCAYVWHSRNPVNNLEYGYGGVKLFPKSVILKHRKWTSLDMFTGIVPKIKVIDRVSNITAFNTDDFSTWRSAFRECVKLCQNRSRDPDNAEHQMRLNAWTKSKGIAKVGANAAIEFFNLNEHNSIELAKINDFKWLETQYNQG
jgi:hypothetical protein